jgi:hypothetical protein
LTYCSNIHPGESWPEVRANLSRFVPEVKQQVAPRRDFGVGLRLSAAAAAALRAPAALEELKDFFRREGLYTFTINAFPYGVFHGRRVKEDVYLPDWRDPERLRYTGEAAEILAELLPRDGSIEGSISTVPGAFKAAVSSAEDADRMAAQLIAQAAQLFRLGERSGRVIALALEPEPCCFLETIAEAVEFFEARLFSAAGITRMAGATGLSRAEAENALRRHLGICLDLCHAAVEFESPAGSIRALADAGIRIPKLQISAGLRFARVDADTEALLRPFDEGVYLHQVVERSAGQLTRHADLAQAFAAAAVGPPSGDREWRVHFHVPIFLDELGAYRTTQAFIREVLALHRVKPISDHLEVETYTWDVLPEPFRATDTSTAIARELEWVIRQLA